jgi:predicted ABC-type ATPase
LSGRPVLYVLAGVNGAGKSSIGGQHLLDVSGMPWFNPDTFAREYREATGCNQQEANAIAWNEGMRYLDEAVANGTSYTFETTLGGRTVPARIAAAAATHDVVVWYCGLASPELHIARVKARVASGGHDIPEVKIRERCESSLVNLIALLPRLSSLTVYDNSMEAKSGESIADPVLVLALHEGKMLFPNTAAALKATPDWAKPLVEAVLSERG